MIVAFPAEKDLGIDSLVHNHFGSANFFIIADTDSTLVKTLKNKDLNHEHGNCQPLSALGNTHVDAVAAGGIGGGALRKLGAGGIKVLRAVEGTVRENMELVKSGKLPEFMPGMACKGHGINGEGIH